MGGNIDIETQQIFNLTKRKSVDNNNSNDIDASSNFGTSGTVNIRTFTDSNLQSLTEFVINPLESNTIVANSCDVNGDVAESNTFVVSGKGGTIASPIQPLSADNILLSENFATNSNNSQVIQPLHFRNLDITPARGVIKTKDGRVILTAYPTDTSSQRKPQNSSNCSNN
jgi:large exoprotein involved in heme utilization and adhesion